MIINTAGEYTLQYTATDACGNTTTVERELVVEGPPRTVLYTDGTLIINEKSRDIEANIQAHGQPTNIYIPFNQNGATNNEKYIFADGYHTLWYNERASIRSVEIGTNISPTITAYWFASLQNCTDYNLSNLDTSEVTDMQTMFSYNSSLTSLDLSGFNTENVTNMSGMFNNCTVLASLNISSFNTSKVNNFLNMFSNCRALSSVDLTSFDTSNATSFARMFANCQSLVSLDLSSFDTQNITQTENMFDGCSSLKTIYASVLFDISQASLTSYMFSGMSTNLVGGAGTVWNSSNPADKTYAHIDGGTSDPGYFTART